MRAGERDAHDAADASIAESLQAFHTTAGDVAPGLAQCASNPPRAWRSVLTLGPATIQPPPRGGPAAGYEGGIGQFSDRSLLLLDIDALMAQADAGMAVPQG